ncbi:MAG: cytochrome c [Desulfosporosinus sp.]|nr:cytochrome c [Desulfosporosinus sp.]
MMMVKSGPKTVILLMSFIILSVALFGCETPTTSVSEPVASSQTPIDSTVARGLSIYNTQCKVCHGTNGSGGNGPRLIGKTPSASFIQANMPRNKPNSLSSDQVSDLVAYITSLK